MGDNDNRIIEILLVEDNSDDAALAIRALKKYNLANSVLRLEDGVEALDYIFSPNGLRTPKLILLDLKMPRVGGMEVLQKLKSNELTKKIPIVVLTSSKEDPDIEKCYAFGVNSYIVKPVNLEGFTNAVAQLGMYWLMLNQPPK